MTLRILIVDDEAPARSKLKTLLRGFADVQVTGEAEHAPAALAQVAGSVPDVVFLDIEMPGMSGLELATLLPDSVSVVFATAYHQHALAAFDLNAVDYLLKPYTAERLAESLARLRRERALSSASGAPLHDALHALQPAAGHWLVQQRGHLQRVAVADIEWVDAADNYVEIHTAARTFLDRVTLAEFLAKVPGRRFVRIHRSCAVNPACISALDAMARGDAELTLRNGKVLRVSRRYRALLAAQFP